MCQIIIKIIGLLLIPAFLVASIGSVPGYAWCFGEDGHKDFKKTAIVGCSDGQNETKDVVKYDTPSIYSSDDECCDSCFHFSAQQGEIVFSKQYKKPLQTTADEISLNVFSQSFAQSVKLVATNLASQPPPRISQTILAHRTVVLLN